MWTTELSKSFTSYKNRNKIHTAVEYAYRSKYGYRSVINKSDNSIL